MERKVLLAAKGKTGLISEYPILKVFDNQVINQLF